MKMSDATVNVRFCTTEEGGRQMPVKGEYYGCVFIVDDEAFDCRVLLSGHELELGRDYDLEVMFLNPTLVLPRLSRAKPLSLWEGKVVANGTIKSVASA